MDSDRIILASAFVAIGAFCYTQAFSASIDNLPAAKSQGDVTYVSGGVGRSEAKAFEHAEHRYPLSLEFVQHAKPRDEFLADVEVTIKDHKGNTELDTKVDGPFLLAKIPAGKYTVTAEDNGKTKISHVAVAAGKPEHLVFTW
jgi:hypothetical protein